MADPPQPTPPPPPPPLDPDAVLGNLEDAAVSARVLGSALDGALFLDEDALRDAAGPAAAAASLRAGRTRLLELRAELDDARARSAGLEASLAEARAEADCARAATAAHVEELVAALAENARLKAAVEALSGGATTDAAVAPAHPSSPLPSSAPATTIPPPRSSAADLAAQMRAELEAERAAAEMIARAEEEEGGGGSGGGGSDDLAGLLGRLAAGGVDGGEESD
jgi:hypothetical protein